MKKKYKIADSAKKIIGLDTKKLSWIFLVVFIVGLIPLLYLSGYVHASGDDYGYGAGTHAIWLETHSVFQTLARAAKTSVDYWHSWQGTWFTIFLMALQPEVFSPDGYWIVPWIMLAITIAATSLVTYYFLVNKLELKKGTWACINILFLLMMVQYFPRTKSAIFWWNGTVHYIVPYGLAMIAVYGMFRFVDTAKKRYFVYVCLSMFCLGGSSYLAPLLALVVLGYLLVFIRNKKHIYWLLIPAGIELAGLFISFIAPGNTRRGGEDFGFHWMLVIETIAECFRQGTLAVAEYIQNAPFILVVFAMIAMFVTEALLQKKEKKKFPLPLLFTVLMYCLYCAMYAPGIYAGVEVSGGVPNTIFQVFLLTFLAVLVYDVGWFCSRRKETLERNEVWKIRCWFMPLIMACLIFLLFNKGTLKDSTVYECYEYISSGQADDYKMQMEERLELLLNPDLKEVELPAMNPEQGPLMHMEVMENPDAWTNTVAEQFFQKDKIVQVQRQQ